MQLLIAVLILCPVLASASDQTCPVGEFLYQKKSCQPCSKYLSNCNSCRGGNYQEIINGSFEEPLVSALGYQYFDYLPGWRTSFSLMELRSVQNANEGAQFAEPAPLLNNDIYQELVTEQGFSYRVDFYYAPRPTLAANTLGVNFYWGDVLIETISQSGLALPFDTTSWEQHSHVLEAKDSVTRVLFEGTGINDAFGGYIDSVSYANLPMCIECPEGYYLSQVSMQCAVCPEDGNASGPCLLSEGEKRLEYTIIPTGEYYLFQFTYALKHLTQSNLISMFIPSNEVFQFDIKTRSSFQYELWPIQVPRNTTAIRIEFLNIESLDGAVLQEGQNSVQLQVPIDAQLEAFNIEPSNQGYTESIEERSASKYLANAGFISVFALAVLTTSPATLWSFMNFSIMIYFLPLQNVGMPERLKVLCQEMSPNVFGLIPNMGQKMGLQQGYYSRAPKMWRGYGIESTSLVINAGETLFVIACGIVLLPVFALAYSAALCIFKRRVRYIRKKISDYRYNFFLRASVQSFMEIIPMSLLCALSAIQKSEYSVEAVFSLLFVLCGVLFVPLMVSLMWVFRGKITSGLPNWQTYFEEFKQGSYKQWLYYPLFYARRLLYAFGLFFLEDQPLAQVIINSTFSLVIAVYVIACNPYKSFSNTLCSMICELALLVAFVVSGLCLLNPSETAAQILWWVLFGAICTVVIAELTTSLIVLIRRIAAWCRNRAIRVGNGFAGIKARTEINETKTVTEKINPQYEESKKAIILDDPRKEQARIKIQNFFKEKASFQQSEVAMNQELNRTNQP